MELFALYFNLSFYIEVSWISNDMDIEERKS